MKTTCRSDVSRDEALPVKPHRDLRRSYTDAVATARDIELLCCRAELARLLFAKKQKQPSKLGSTPDKNACRSDVSRDEALPVKPHRDLRRSYTDAVNGTRYRATVW